MYKHVSRNPKNPREAYRYALECGRKADRANAEAKQFAQDGYEKWGRPFLDRLGTEFTVDDRGRVHREGEYYTWTNGVEELVWLATAAHKEGWSGGELADFAQSCWTMFGHEPAARVRGVIRELAESGRDLESLEVMGKLSAVGAMVAHDEQETDLG